MKHFTYTYGALSDAGDVRGENQDHILCRVYKEENAALFLVADGMGGLSFGSQVSSYAASRFAAWLDEDFSQMVQAGRDSDEDIKELLEQEIWDINDQIYGFKERENCRCGSTLSVLLFYQGKYYMENMGDSRIYCFKRGQLKQLTVDQSLAAQLVREKKLTPEEAEDFPQKNVLTMCLGMFPVPRSGFKMGKLEAGDVFLLCSDGFYGYVPMEQVKETLKHILYGKKWGDVDMQASTEELRSLIPSGAARDNVSLILTEVSK